MIHISATTQMTDTDTSKAYFIPKAEEPSTSAFAFIGFGTTNVFFNDLSDLEHVIRELTKARNEWLKAEDYPAPLR